MIVMKKHLSRRTILRGIGASLALPLLDGMLPAFMPRAFAAAQPIKRFGAIYVGMGMNMNTWMSFRNARPTDRPPFMVGLSAPW